jgi:hypothetical protein
VPAGTRGFRVLPGVEEQFARVRAVRAGRGVPALLWGCDPQAATGYAVARATVDAPNLDRPGGAFPDGAASTVITSFLSTDHLACLTPNSYLVNLRRTLEMLRSVVRAGRPAACVRVLDFYACPTARVRAVAFSLCEPVSCDDAR